jgi:branched-chain amino acid transport system ATP-binding protein
MILSVENVSLAFGGVKALSEVSFDVREHEIRAIIGPNGAGKSSMLNVLNGVYHPQEGRIRFQQRVFADMDPHEAAAMGIARTFQNIALFKGMTVLDNIMTGRNLKMRSTSSRSSTSARRRSGACPTACRSASSWAARSPRSPGCCCWTSRWPA